MTGKFVAREKSRAFALRVVKLCRLLQERDREYVLSRQLLRSGTAIGALIREAEQALLKKPVKRRIGWIY